ncbi:MAG TPA: class I SAM-dependent methyltransferase, partial [Acidimicrobiales bacterium]|nr:class I SAM-dependent methyltransferase [Acidimicrobiales bacterium]
AVGAGGSVLELGSGPGRMTHPLVAQGHEVVAVDASAEMLAHVEGAERVQADLYTLVLHRRFDGVLAASHLINEPSAARRAALLDVCRRHVADDGVVLVQRYEPGWAAAPESGYGTVGPVEIDVEIHARRGADFDATVTYTLGDRTWAQSFTATAVDDDQLAAEAAAHGLHLDAWLDDRRTWARLRPVGGATGTG